MVLFTKDYTRIDGQQNIKKHKYTSILKKVIRKTENIRKNKMWGKTGRKIIIPECMSYLGNLSGNYTVIGHFNLEAVAKNLSLFLPLTEYLVQPVPK